MCTPLSKVSPTIWPKKSVKLTGWPICLFLIILSMFLYTPCGDRSQSRLESILFFISSCMAPGAICGQLWWEYNVDMYLKYMYKSFIQKLSFISIFCIFIRIRVDVQFVHENVGILLGDIHPGTRKMAHISELVLWKNIYIVTTFRSSCVDKHFGVYVATNISEIMFWK